MNKICCVDDADICPNTSSCSMVLRSACSHRHSRESSTVSQRSRSGTPHKRKHTSLSPTHSYNDSSHLASVLQSSLKELALKSASSTYSILKQHIYNNYELSENVNQNVYQVSSLNVSCARELQFSHLSPSNNSALSSSVSHKACSSDYSSADESDFNDLVNSTSNMSRTRLTRSSLSSVRALSGSEDENNGISISRVTKSKRIKSNVNENHDFAGGVAVGEAVSNSHYHSNNHASYNEMRSDVKSHSSKFTGTSESSNNSQSLGTESSQLDMSNVQYSSFDRFRWFLWRCSYLKIIRNVNFDVWFLSKLNSYKKHWVIFFLLLPLLLYIIFGLPWHSAPVSEEFSHTSNVVFSSEEFSHTSNVWLSSTHKSISYVLSWLYDVLAFMLSVLFRNKEEEMVVTSAINNEDENVIYSSKIFSSLSGGFDFFYKWFVGSSETVSATGKSKYQPKEIPAYLDQPSKEVIQSLRPSREEIRFWAQEVLKDEINLLKEEQESESQRTRADKVENELKLQNDIKNFRLELKLVSGTIEKLKASILKQSQNEMSHKEHVFAVTEDYRKDIDMLNMRLKTIEAKLGVLEGLKNSDKQWSQADLLAMMEENLIVAFRNIVDGDADPSSRYYFFNQWLNTKVFSHEKLMHEINVALKQQSSAHQETGINHDYVLKVVESTVLKYVESVKKNLTEFSSSYLSFGQDMFTEDKIKKTVKEAIMLYDADKTGQVDYALESGGGSVLSTRCSETYVEKYGKISILGIPFWTNSNSPRTAIQPDMQPGRCWAFKGSQGFLVIELSAIIYPTGFTLEHIPVSLSPSGSIDSAPKNFSVMGLASDKDSSGKLLGEYSYDINGEPLQYFPIQKLSERPYSYVELQIHSNQGNMEYTCLYRFRVHGRRVQ